MIHMKSRVPGDDFFFQDGLLYFHMFSIHFVEINLLRETKGRQRVVRQKAIGHIDA
jgi:hypothetical protein